MKLYIRSNYEPQIYDIAFINSAYRQQVAITCASSTRDTPLTRVKSSNVWAYGMKRDTIDEKTGTGDLLVQFKDKYGGPGHIYIYYDVPTKLYRQFITTPSKGSWFWKNIRHRFNYSKLTGDKRGKFPNAIN